MYVETRMAISALAGCELLSLLGIIFRLTMGEEKVGDDLEFYAFFSQKGKSISIL